MKKSVLLLASFAASFSSLAFSQSLDIPADKTFLVDKKIASTSYSRLSVGDNARIEFEDGLRFWSLNLDSLEVGSNVVINANGKKGGDGEPGLAGQNAEENCTDGKPGEKGGDGLDGSQGKSVLIKAKQASIGSLLITAKGGAGGNGGAGGIGGNGKEGRSCKGGDAGNGGDGGHAGDGGRGGQVELYLPESLLGESNKIKVDVSGGIAGEVGAGGKPGQPAEGHYLNRGSSTGMKKWISGGLQGEAGKAGDPAENGGDGIFATYIQGKTPARQSQNAARSTEKVSQQTMTGVTDLSTKDLLQRIEALEKRVKALESK